MADTLSITIELTPKEYADLVDGNTHYSPELSLGEYSKESLLRINKDNLLVCDMLLEEAPD